MAYVTNIQRYSVHDGPGLRTAIFFKGCPLDCLWCHNPETICFLPRPMHDAASCAACGNCSRACPSGALRQADGVLALEQEKCTACGECARACPTGALELAGLEYSPRELAEICKRDILFYETSGGGVTLSGGEAMAQPAQFLLELLRALEREGISAAVDTCGHAPWSAFEAVLEYVDVFLYDIKHMNDARHRELTGAGNALILQNLTRLSRAGADIWLRLPLIEGVNSSDADILALTAFLRENGIRPRAISLLPYHATGEYKRERLLQRPNAHTFAPPGGQRLEQIRALLAENGFAGDVG